ncbi:MAG: beta-lactamase family protein [Gammaproteobacteria bacterium]|nr:beta-lactamase family protein [Gammaproteobacteria bacterium]
MRGRVDLEAPASRYLDPSLMAGIHVLQGVDASERVTVRQLLSHTSGIADYFEQPRRSGSNVLKDLLREDFAWTLADVLDIAKTEMSPRFAPGAPGKAFYSDTNYQLLGAVIESICGCTYEAALTERIIGPLGLTDTYPFTLETLSSYPTIAPVLYGKAPVAMPRAMASFRADGGIVSNAVEGAAFLEAFMTGRLFDAVHLGDMQKVWRPIFFPLTYGVGMMRFKLPRLFTLWQKVPAMIGHSGASGALLFPCAGAGSPMSRAVSIRSSTGACRST